MREIVNQIQEIIQDIEGRKMRLNSNEKSTDEVIQLLLGRSNLVKDNGNYINNKVSIQNAKTKLEMINDPAVWNIKFNRNVNRLGVMGKVKNVCIRVVRKIIRPVMQDIVNEQTRYNSYNVQILNEMFSTSVNQERAIYNITKEINDLKGKEKEIYTVLDYEQFENNFRGPEYDIKDRQKEYLPYLKSAQNLLDIGCGRGEFLELMKENGIQAVGVDMYPGFVQRCLEKGLNVVEGDGINYLESFEDESLDAITAFQVAEHLPTVRLVELCQIAYRKLTKGGILILETPNPTCLSIYTNSFYIDSSHVKPVHPQALDYYAGVAGFTQREIYYTKFSRVGETIPAIAGENSEEFNKSMKKLTDLIYGSQDYALIATK